MHFIIEVLLVSFAIARYIRYKGRTTVVAHSSQGIRDGAKLEVTTTVETNDNFKEPCPQKAFLDADTTQDTSS